MIVCVTNGMDHVRSCTYRASHEDRCDGREWAWISKRHREETTGKPCGGCAPRNASTGFVCRSCFEKITAALAAAPRLIRELGRTARFVTRDAGGRSSAALGYVPLPATRLAIDEITRRLASRRGSPDNWVSTVDGARDAIMLALAVRMAERAFPMEEQKHRLNVQRCPKCSQRTLVREPPQMVRMDVVVRCLDVKCGHEMDQATFETMAAIEGNPRLGPLVTMPWDDKPEPVPFDAKNPAHMALLVGAA